MFRVDHDASSVVEQQLALVDRLCNDVWELKLFTWTARLQIEKKIFRTAHERQCFLHLLAACLHVAEISLRLHKDHVRNSSYEARHLQLPPWRMDNRTLVVSSNESYDLLCVWLASSWLHQA